MTSRELKPVVYRPIGIARTRYSTPAGMPLQSVAAPDEPGRIELDPELEPGLRDLDGFSHVYVISHLHRSAPGDLLVVPFLDQTQRGVFATRSPRHPNPIGLSIVRLLGVDGSTLHVTGLDLLDGTPVLDVKPYVPTFDRIDAERAGWFEGRADDVHTRRADDRFTTP
ncbi:MAG TPA: tRNA (N6-threonylcarbamoyladenosine(37)-N6)-methyltransferase TrmO [Gaiellaceae bacterium]